MQGELLFNIQIDDPNNNYQSFYPQIRSHILAAGADWDTYIEGSANLEVYVGFSTSIPRATGRSFTSNFVGTNGTFNVFEQGATGEIRTGVDPNGTTPDIELIFNPNYLSNELWFDPNPQQRTSIVPTNKTDAVSVFLHELGHAFAFNGWRDATNGNYPGNYQSTFDKYTIFDGNNFYFTGSQARSVYGGDVPLTFGNWGHLGNNSPRPGSNLIPDLMNGVVFNRGSRYDISALDVAILTDTGVPIYDTPTATPEISVNNVFLVEGVTTNAVFTVSLSNASTSPVTVSYTTQDGTATTAAPDYTAKTGTVSFAVGQTSKTVSIPIINNNISEPDETFNLVLSNPQNATISDGTGIATISDTFTSSVTTTLPTGVENLILTGNANINGTGNAGNNIITGNRGNNILNGANGNDRLNGDAGNDNLTGSAGNDTLTGGVGDDQFIFSTGVAFTAASLGRDTITDLTTTDKIVLSKTTFTTISSGIGGGFSVANEFATVTADSAAAISSAAIVYNSSNGKLFYNQNGASSGFGTGAHFLTITGNPAVVANNFVIIA